MYQSRIIITPRRNNNQQIRVFFLGLAACGDLCCRDPAPLKLLLEAAKLLIFDIHEIL
jgi:hypothetical protein